MNNSSFYQVGGTLPGDSPAYVTFQVLSRVLILRLN
jgi:hypothetical protein